MKLWQDEARGFLALYLDLMAAAPFHSHESAASVEAGTEVIVSRHQYPNSDQSALSMRSRHLFWFHVPVHNHLSSDLRASFPFFVRYEAECALTEQAQTLSSELYPHTGYSTCYMPFIIT